MDEHWLDRIVREQAAIQGPRVIALIASAAELSEYPELEEEAERETDDRRRKEQRCPK